MLTHQLIAVMARLNVCQISGFNLTAVLFSRREGLSFHTWCTVPVPSVDLGFNWIGGLGSLRLSLFSLFRLLHRHDRHDLEITETSKNDPNNFLLIIFPRDDRSPTTPHDGLEQVTGTQILSSLVTIFVICCEKLSYLISVK